MTEPMKITQRLDGAYVVTTYSLEVARQVVAAPDLLAALTEIDQPASAYIADMPRGKLRDAFIDSLKKARAAIAKARGQ